MIRKMICVAMVLVLIICSGYEYPVHATETSQPLNISQGEYLTEEEAKCFIGFLFSTNNLSDEQLKENNMFNLMVGNLSGQEEEEAGLQFLKFLNARLAKTSEKLGNLNDYSNEFLINYLTTGVNEGKYGGSIADEIVNDTLKSISNQFQEYFYEEYLISGQGLENMEYEYFQDGMLAKQYWEKLQSIPDKVEEYSKQVLALSNTIFYVTSSNREEMYNYFLLYKNNLNIKYEIGQEAFDLVMDTNQLLNEKLTLIKLIEPTLANWEFLDERLLLWATEDRIALIERWAEYTYLLEKRIEENATSFENKDEDTSGNSVHYAVIAKEDLEYELTADGAIITGYYGGYSYAKIPNSIDGYKVVGIGANAFSCEPWLRYIYIPASVQNIADNAFLNCYGLKKAIILNGDTIFGERVFTAYRSQVINGREFTLDKGLGVTLYGAGGSNVQKYANSSGNIFESTDWDGETITEVYPIDNTYYINTVSELAWVAEETNSGNTFKGKTIVLSGTLNFNTYSWTPIGSASRSFEGKIEIIDCDIINFKCRQTGAGYYAEVRSGVFGDVKTTDILVSEVTVNNADVYAFGYQTVNAGALFGKVQINQQGKLVIENSQFKGKVYAEADVTGGVIGALTVNASASVIIRDVEVDWDLGGSVKYLHSMNEGGIIGYVSNSGNIQITNCDVKGNFVALGGNGTVNQCHPGRAGGLIGYLANNNSGIVDIKEINSEFSAQTSSGDSYGCEIGSLIAYVTNKGKINIIDTRNVVDVQKGSFYGCIGGEYWVKGVTITNSYVLCQGKTQNWNYNHVPYNVTWCNSYFLNENISFYVSNSSSDETKKQMKVLQSHGRTVDELKDRNTFEGWDFEQVWCWIDGEYPVLLEQVQGKEHYKIRAESLQGGSISSTGITSVVEGTDITYIIEPEEAYYIDKLIVDGVEKAATEEYTFSNVMGNHTIVATFKEKERHYINYELNGGVQNINAPEYVNEGLYVTLKNPSKAGCAFGGWYDNPEYSGSKLLTISSEQADTISLYAKWECVVRIRIGTDLGFYVSETSGSTYQRLQEGHTIESILLEAEDGRFFSENYIESIEYDRSSGLVIERINYKKIRIYGDLHSNVSLNMITENDDMEVLVGNSLSLTGNIGVNFYMHLLEDATAEGSYMRFTLPDGKTTEIYVKDAPLKTIEDTECHMFTCEIMSTQMTGEISAQMVLRDGTLGEKYIYSAKKYADIILSNQDNNSIYEAATPLVKAMLNYGGYAQAYFQYDDSPLANIDLIDEESIENVSLEMLSSYVSEKTGNVKGIKYYGSSLLLKSETTIRHYFYLDEGVEIEDFVFELNGETLCPRVVGDYCYVDIESIASGDLDTYYTVNVGDFSIRYCAMCYVKDMLEKDSTEESLENLLKALYLYNQEANKYFGK